MYYRMKPADIREVERREKEWKRREGCVVGDYMTHYNEVRKERERALPLFRKK